MNTRGIFRPALIGLLALLLAAPPAVYGQESAAAAPFKQEQLDQMLAPIALYPDSLLAQVLVAATYPLEVVAADRWVKQNKSLKGEQLNAALDKMTWDLSVKALVPFPEVLAMMSEKLDWTQNLGDAFIGQQAQVMDTVQKLRAKAQGEGNLKTTKEQKVVVQDQTIVIEPASPTTVYVPSYNPAVVYGAWPYPAYPPYPYYPYGGAVAAGVFGFAAGVAVGAAWNNGWGNWNWGHGDMNVNVNRNTNINRNNINTGNIRTGNFQPDASHRKGVQYRDQASRDKYGQKAPGSAQARNDFRGNSPGDARGQGAQQRGDRASASRPEARPSGQPRASTQPAGRPTADSTAKGLQQRQSGGAFGDMGSGRDAKMSSDRGNASRSASSAGMRSPSSGGGRSSSMGGGGASRGGGGGGGGRGGGGGGRGGGGGGRGGGGRR
jgi:uncharacterized membrane protein YgcG